MLFRSQRLTAALCYRRQDKATLLKQSSAVPNRKFNRTKIQNVFLILNEALLRMQSRNASRITEDKALERRNLEKVGAC